MPVTIDYARFDDPQIEAAIRKAGFDAVTEGCRWFAERVQEAQPATYKATRRMAVLAPADDDAEQPWLDWEQRKLEYQAF